MSDLITYIPIFITAALGVFGLFFNTKKDPDKPKKNFNTLTLTGWVTFMFILLSLLFAFIIKKQDKENKDLQVNNLREEKRIDAAYKDSAMKMLTKQLKTSDQAYAAIKAAYDATLENKELSKQKFEDQKNTLLNESKQLKYDLGDSKARIKELKEQNESLSENLSRQMEVNYFSLLNQTLLEPKVEIIINTKQNYSDGKYVEELRSSMDSLKEEIRLWQYFSTKHRQLLFPKYLEENWGSKLNQNSNEYLIGSLELNIHKIWNARIWFFNTGVIVVPSNYKDEKYDAALKEGIGNNDFQVFAHSSKLRISLQEKTRANAAILYNRLKETNSIFQYHYYFKEDTPDEIITNRLLNIKDSISNITIVIPINPEANLGFLLPLSFQGLK